jgi:hypothetical protein
MATTKPEQGYLSITVPCENNQTAFIIERLNGTRIAIRVGKLVVFFTYSEAAKVAGAMLSLMGLRAEVKR